ncbi:MAG: glycosyltransferase family 1 protein [Candidatus Binatia bacterium]
MRVGLDLTCLKAPMGGYERYASRLLHALVRLPDPPEMVAFIERTYGPHVVPAEAEARPVATLPKFLLKVMLQDQTYWPMLMRRARVDVVHTPIFAGMIAAPRPYVLTLHDLIPLQTPQAMARSAAYWRIVLPRAARRADAIITGSDFTRDEIRAFFDFPSDRVITIPHGVEPRFAPVLDPTVLARVRARHDLPARFILFVGIASPRKNVDRLVRAFSALADSDRGDAQLVLAGPAGWKNESLEQAVAASRVAARIRHLGVVPEDDLPGLYSLASAVANLSSREGFGLPALEALACGAPLVCADRTSFPEVVGDAALLVDPDDEAAVTASLADVLRGGPGVAARRTRGLVRARTFTWERAAAATREVYRRVVG